MITSHTDGRDIDLRLGTLQGEGAEQVVRSEETRIREAAQPYLEAPATEITYYGRPLLKQSVWTFDIPLYYFLGGAAGAAMTLGAAIQLVAPPERGRLREVAAICHWTGILGSTAGAGFLIHDLGRPSRFLHMMRVFRPTSPMNMGVWILSGAAPAAIAAGLFINRRGFWGKVGEISGYTAGVFGAALAGYTGVLVANTAIPVYQASRRWLPVLFLASGAASAASIIDIFVEPEATLGITRIFGTAARVAEIAAAEQMEHAASEIPRVGLPLREGPSGLLWNAAAVLTTASLAVSLFPGKSHRKSRIAACLSLAGALCVRFAVHHAGDASSRDASALFAQQRAAKHG